MGLSTMHFLDQQKVAGVLGDSSYRFIYMHRYHTLRFSIYIIIPMQFVYLRMVQYPERL